VVAFTTKRNWSRFCVYIFFVVFSERELTFTFAICYRPSVCVSVVCL